MVRGTMSDTPTFKGFPAIEANYTMCPNMFFDRIVGFFEPCVVNVVAILIRETLGWRNQHTGTRKIEAEVALSTFVRHGMSQESARKGLRLATEAGLIIRTEPPSPKDPARYALRWEDPATQKQAIKEERQAFRARRTKAGGLRDRFSKQEAMPKQMAKPRVPEIRVPDSSTLEFRVPDSAPPSNKGVLNKSSPEKKQSFKKGSASLARQEADVLGGLAPAEWAALEVEARARVIAENRNPVRALAQQGKAMERVRAMMRTLLAEKVGVSGVTA